MMPGTSRTSFAASSLLARAGLAGFAEAEPKDYERVRRTAEELKVPL